MRRTTTALLLISALGSLYLGGCLEKKIDVTFTNLTDERLDVYLNGPLKVQPDELPAQYSWSAGAKYDGRFTIQKLRKIPPRFIDIGVADTKTHTKPAQ